MIKLDLQSVWSKLQPEVPLELPPGWRLATHQWEVYQALQDPDVDVVFDTAMTGDGKTLAACLPLLRPAPGFPPRGLLAYPTNELIHDQGRQIRAYLERFGRVLAVQELNSAEMDLWSRNNDEAGRYVTIQALIDLKDVLLTNPDLFHLIESFRYANPMQNPATLAQKLIIRYRYIVFDEFHIFGAAQVAAVLDAMLFIRATLGPQYPPKFLFLSATPSKLILDALDSAGFRHRMLSGQYQNGDGPFLDHRQILQRASLEFEPSDASTQGIVGWCERNVERLRSFFATYPGSKGVLICNSVLKAKQVYRLLSEALSPLLKIGENTGLTGRAMRHASYEADLIVATSTVDVGVDFKINLLVFESLDAGSFIQRLGRLGRHPGFSTYQAVALLPPFIVERIEQAFDQQPSISRVQFLETLRGDEAREGIFPVHQEFRGYLPRWGSMLAAQRLCRLRDRRVQERYKTLYDAYEPMARQAFRITQKTIQRAWALREAAIMDELRAFRGSSQMDVWVHDPDTKAVRSIPLPRLLAGTEFTLIESSEAKKICRELGETFREVPLNLYAVLDGYLQQTRPVNFKSLDALVDATRPQYSAVERSGFQVEVRHPSAFKVNQKLQRLVFCTCAAESGLDEASLRRQLRLPPFFELHPITDIDGRTHVLAFGQDALLLDSIVFWRRGDDHAYIC